MNRDHIAIFLVQPQIPENIGSAARAMSNMGLSVACKRYGFKNHAAKVGDRYVLEDMQRLGGVLGGEESGHVIFLDHHTTGDGILSAMQLLAAMLKADKPLSEMAKLMDVFPQKLINVDVKSKPDIQTVPQIVEAIKQVESELKDEGRVLVRYSGTELVARVMVEGEDEGTVNEHAEAIADAIRRVLSGDTSLEEIARVVDLTERALDFGGGRGLGAAAEIPLGTIGLAQSGGRHRLDHGRFRR